MRVLSRLFRRLFLQSLHEAFDEGQLRFAGSLETLSDGRAFAQHLAAVRQVEWVVYAKAPFAGPQQVLDYVGRYTHRVAISNQRLIDLEDGHVRFRYKDYRVDSSQQSTSMTLAATEFIRRFLLHALPAGFHRIRYYGFLGNRARREKLALCRRLLDRPAPTDTSTDSEAVTDHRDAADGVVGVIRRACPLCGDGHMHVVEQLVGTRGRSAVPDTS